jgi:hypothetical protein
MCTDYLIGGSSDYNCQAPYCVERGLKVPPAKVPLAGEPRGNVRHELLVNRGAELAPS